MFTVSDTVVIFPTAIESRPFCERHAHLCRTVIGGMGPEACAAATQSVIDRFHPARLILAGVAGAYAGRGAEADGCYWVDCDYDADLLLLPATDSAQTERRMSAGFAPRATFSDLSMPRLNANTVWGVPAPNLVATDAALENMEGNAFLNCCLRAGVECGQIRAVSNFVGQSRDRWRIEPASSRLAERLTCLLQSFADTTL